MHPYQDCLKVYGPYTRKDGRQHVLLMFEGRRQQTVSYPKYLMELHLGRKLVGKEEVHHKDEDPLNNELSNLEIRMKGEHQASHSKGNSPFKRLVDKYGLEEARRIVASHILDKAKGGRGNKGKPKGEEHRKKISEGMRGNCNNPNGCKGKPK